MHAEGGQPQERPGIHGEGVEDQHPAWGTVLWGQPSRGGKQGARVGEEKTVRAQSGTHTAGASALLAVVNQGKRSPHLCHAGGAASTSCSQPAWLHAAQLNHLIHLRLADALARPLASRSIPPAPTQPTYR